MNKKAIKIVIPIVSILLVSAVVAGVVLSNFVNLGKTAQAEIYYENLMEEIYVTTTVSEEDNEILRNMVDGKKLKKADGNITNFDDKIYLSFSDGKKVKHFYISCDQTPQLKYNGKILQLSAWEIDQLYYIVGKYGAVLPLDRIS